MLSLSAVSAFMLFAFSMSNNKDHQGTVSSLNMGAVYDRLAERLSTTVYSENNDDDDAAKSQMQYWVAIAGGAGSGKTTSADSVAERLNEKHGADCCVVVPMDGFHYSQQRLKELHGPSAMLRRGAPWTFDAEGLVRALTVAKMEHQAV